MYRTTQNNSQDLQSICNIYNEITGRKRTQQLHAWEWFASPYKNKSYVIVNKEGKILGHHGILTIKLHNQNQVYNTGKTENTIMKPGFGPLYFKNEMEMHKEYLYDYNILITTTAHGVTKKIREKLGYKVFANYVSYVKIVDFNILTFKVKNKLFGKLLKMISPVVNLFLFKSKTNSKFTEMISDLKNTDLDEIELFYNRIKNSLFYSQVRSKEFLEYRVLNNPYNKYFLLKLYDSQKLIGYVLYTAYENKLNIEDILFNEESVFQELLNRLYNYAKENKIAYAISFTTLEKSILDKDVKGFIRRINNKERASQLMLKNNIINQDKNTLKIENFYFTQLMMEGIR
jgi:hypothetical protein